jgi:uncharacterized protein (TIGR03435 family)
MRGSTDEGLKSMRKSLSAIIGMIVVLAAILAGLLTSPLLRAQAPATDADRPAFDVSSIKPSKSGGPYIGRGGNAPEPGRFRAVNITLRFLIANAYLLTPGESVTRIFGAPNWIDSESFDVEAKAEGNPSPDRMRLMLQSLLADRFKLALHHETRQLPVYALVLAKPGKMGLQLKPHSDDAKCVDPDAKAAPTRPRPGDPLPAFCGEFAMFGAPPSLREAGNKITIAMLVEQLSNFVDRPIVDRTGLTGTYDATLEFAFAFKQGGAPDGTANAMIPSDPSGPPSIFTALQEQLGLKLESQKGPADVLVIDHVEEPSPN